jgi:hypothetical protein
MTCVMAGLVVVDAQAGRPPSEAHPDERGRQANRVGTMGANVADEARHAAVG